MQQEIPVVVAHFGTKPDYLRIALESAARFNRHVVLIGDAANKGFWNNHWETVPSKIQKFCEFEKHYIHMSTFSQVYEVSCFKRLFALEEWMKINSYERAFHLDSDLMTFANYPDVVCPTLPKGTIATLMTMEKQDENFMWSTSCHFSYWTIEALRDFTNFCINAYKDKTILDQLKSKWQWHVENGKGGGITDMTLLYFWAKDNPKVLNFTNVIHGMTADYNFNLSAQYYFDEYETSFGLKKFTFKDGIPYGYNRRLKTWVRFLCVHCQGAGKYAMPFLNNEFLKKYYVLTRIFYRIKSKYFRFSSKKLNKFLNRHKKLTPA
jgi:hypothetical protein